MLMGAVKLLDFGFARPTPGRLSSRFSGANCSRIGNAFIATDTGFCTRSEPVKIRLFRPGRLFGGDLMQTFRQNRAMLLLAAALMLAGSATISGQRPAVVDSAVLKKAGTPADQFP